MEIRFVENKDWIFIVLLLIFGILAFVKTKYPRRFQEFMLLPLTNKYFSVEGKVNEVFHPFNLLLFLVQVLSFSLFICLILSSGIENIENSPILFIQVFTAYSLIILAKFYIEKLIAHILNIEFIVEDYLYKKLSYLNSISLIVLILSVIGYYVYIPNPNTFVFVLFGIFTLYTATLILSAQKNRTLILRNFFYFISYLCALEFAPYVILYKLVV